jgi:hypothetical protein
MKSSLKAPKEGGERGFLKDDILACVETSD